MCIRDSYGRAFVFAKRGTDPVTKKQVLTHCCAATVSIVGVTEFSFGLFSYFSSPSGIYRRAFVFAKRGPNDAAGRGAAVS